jgi:hypothetical protein
MTVATPSYLSDRGITRRGLWGVTQATANVTGRLGQALSITYDEPRQMRVPRDVAQAPWFQSVLHDLAIAATMPQAWDSYFGAPVRTKVAAEALVFLSRFLHVDAPAPQVVPLADGGVQLEWHRSGLDVEITFPSTGNPELYFHDSETRAEHDVEVTSARDPEVFGLLSLIGARL